MKRFCCILGATLLLAGCYSNAIYYDIEGQSVVRCKGIISRLEVSSEDGVEDVRFRVLPNSKGNKWIKLQYPNEKYSIESMYTKFAIDYFHLRPLRKYTITHRSNGDAATAELVIETDSSGKVFSASKTRCETK